MIKQTIVKYNPLTSLPHNTHISVTPPLNKHNQIIINCIYTNIKAQAANLLTFHINDQINQFIHFLLTPSLIHTIKVLLIAIRQILQRGLKND